MYFQLALAKALAFNMLDIVVDYDLRGGLLNPVITGTMSMLAALAAVN